jgi:hypothetical protein
VTQPPETPDSINTVAQHIAYLSEHRAEADRAWSEFCDDVEHVRTHYPHIPESARTALAVAAIFARIKPKTGEAVGIYAAAMLVDKQAGRSS